MLLDRFRQTPAENKIRTVDYTSWLEDTETLTSVLVSVSPTSSPAFGASVGIVTGGKKLLVTAGGGVEGETYTVRIKASTSLGQDKDDCLEFIVESPCS